MLGSVHVLEGMSTLLADEAADAIRRSIGNGGTEGFSYLRSHGALDIEHVAFFKQLVNGIADTKTQQIVIDASKVFYRLYGDIFTSLRRATPSKVMQLEGKRALITGRDPALAGHLRSRLPPRHDGRSVWPPRGPAFVRRCRRWRLLRCGTSVCGAILPCPRSGVASAIISGTNGVASMCW